jgi:hypothetical protein
MEKEWKSVVEEFEAKGILKEALEELNSPEYTMDFILVKSPYFFFARRSNLFEIRNNIVSEIDKIFRTVDSLPKRNGMNFNLTHTCLYQQRDETNPKKITKEAITPVTWSRLGLNDYRPTKRTVFSIALTIFFLQNKCTTTHPVPEECIKHLNALLLYQGEILASDHSIIDGVVKRCIESSIFDLSEVNYKIEEECEKKGVKAEKFLLGIHHVGEDDNRRKKTNEKYDSR